MKSYPTPDQVLADLGDKVTEALSGSVLLARDDLLDYRNARPAWVAEHTERGLASWIHDRQWYHLVAMLSEIPGVSLRDAEPVREIYVGLNYHIRVKRHHWDGRVSTYPTQGALDFMAQPPEQEALDGLHEIHLLAGYFWDRDIRDITAPVLSLRDGVDRTLWLIELPPPDRGQGTGTDTLPISPSPTPPTILPSRHPVEEGEETPE